MRWLRIEASHDRANFRLFWSRPTSTRGGSLYLNVPVSMNFSAEMGNYGFAFNVTCATNFGIARHTRIGHFERVDRVMKKRTIVVRRVTPVSYYRPV